MHFENIEYLQYGTPRQQEAYFTLTHKQILSKLKHFDPILVGTIPINIDIENSDLDIICCVTSNQSFIETVKHNFRNEKHFTIREQQNVANPAIVANFMVNSFEIELFGQNIPTRQQFAYRHLIVEHNLLNQYGEEFRQQIVKLKRQGHKTEPAFAIALGLTGNPYTELLKLEATNKSPNSE